MTVSIIGAGKIGQALAKKFARAKLDVSLASRSGPESVGTIATSIGPTIRAVSVEQALAADIVILAVPFPGVKEAVAGAKPWANRIVVDPTNAIDMPKFTPTDLGGRQSSHVVADAVPGARVVKAFNTLFANVLAEDPAQGDRKRVMFVSGDDTAANAEVSKLVEQLGFAAVDLGKIADGGKLQAWGGPFPTLDVARLKR